MPKKCESCGFFRADNELTECPDCGHRLQFTMFAPPSLQAAACDASEGAKAWNANSAAFEQLELPIGVRISQISAGIGIYCLISRTLRIVFCSLFFVSNTDVQMDRMALALILISLAFQVVGALAGGAVAGIWSVNWVPQGIGVGVGIFFAPLVMLFLFKPVAGTSLPVTLVTMGITTVLSVLGAFIGHKLVRPSRFVVS
jgi:hypothetical protein